MPRVPNTPYPIRGDGSDSSGVSTSSTLTSMIRDPNQEQLERNTANRAVISDQQANGSWAQSYLRHQAEIRDSAAGPISTQLSKQFTRELENASLLNGTVRSVQQELGRGVDIADGEMQIGLTRLVIPPEKIQVDEQTSHTGYAGLRTQTTSIIHSGRGRIQITLDVVFNGTDMINETLREILAQFRGYPYVPVISPYLQQIIQSKVQRKIPESLASQLNTEVATATSKVGDAKIRSLASIDEVGARFSDLKTALKADSDYQSALAKFSGVTTLQDLQTAQSNLTTHFNRVAATLPSDIDRSQAARRAVLNFGQNIDLLQSAILNLTRLRHIEIQAKVGGLVDTQQSIIPCCLDQMTVQTIPGKPKTLRATIALIYFNPIPYGGILQYRDMLGNPTVDSRQALFARRALEKWTMAPAGVAPLPSEAHQRLAPGDAFHQEKFHRDLNIIGLGLLPDVEEEVGDFRIGYASPTMLHEDPAETKKRLGDGLGSMTEHFAAQVPQWHTLTLGNRPGVSIRYISGSLGNRLALHPIPGEYYGSAQYMGAQPGQAVVFMAITDPDILAEIHAMKHANQRMSTLGIRHWRRPEIHIRNPILNLMGIWTAQIEDIKTATVSPNTTEVTINLIEHRIDPLTREAITRPLLFSQANIKKALQYLFKHAQSYVREQHKAIIARRTRPETFSNGDTMLEALNADLKADGKTQKSVLQIRAAMSSDRFEGKQHQKAAFKLLFEEGGIVVPKVIGDAFFIADEEALKNNSAATLISQQVLIHYFSGSPPSIKERAEDIFLQWKGQSVRSVKQDNTFNSQMANSMRSQFSSFGLKPEPDVELSITEPTDNELELLAAHLVRSGGNVTNRLDFISSEKGGNEEVRIQTRDGVDKTADVVSLMTLAQAILHDKAQAPDGEGLQALIFGKGTTMQNYLSSILDHPSTLYADLHLPSYGQALIDLIQAIQIKRTVNDEITRPIESFDQLSNEERALIGIFVPTFRQLGKIPTGKQKTLDDFAYGINDTVLPDFPFYSRNRTDLIRFMEQKSDEKARNGEGTLRKTKEENLQKFVPHDPLHQVKIQKLFDNDSQADHRPSPLAAGTPIASITFENRDILLTEAYAPARHRAAIGDFGTIEQAREIAKAASAQEEDSHLSLRKCFPTLRLFFIEERTREGTWKAIDDVYGFNSIIEVNVTQHKYRPDLAEILLNNLEGNLEYDKFSTAQRDTPEGALVYDSRVEGGIKGPNLGTRELPDTNQRERGEQWLQKFPLREGTRVMLQLGYQSRPDYLETVFTGKIAEVQFGDVIKIVAQSYLAELLIPVVQNVGSETVSGVIEAMMDQETVEHFGKWTPFSHTALSTLEMENAQHVGFWNVLGSQFRGNQADWARYLAAPKLRNVFVGRYSSWWSKLLSQTFLEGSWEVGGGQKTAWDVIQDIINYSPGYIAAVRPYDMEATLFVGRPEQPYFWTDGLRDQERNFEKETKAIKRQTKEISKEIVGRFLSSKFYDGGVTPAELLAKRNPDVRPERFENIETRAVEAEHIELAAEFPKWTRLVETELRDGRFTIDPNLRGKANVMLFKQASTSLAKTLEDILDLTGNTFGSQQVILNTFLDIWQPGTFVRSVLSSSLSPLSLFKEIWDGTEPTLEVIRRAVRLRDIIITGLGITQEAIAFTIDWLSYNRSAITVAFKAILEYLKADPLASFAIRIKATTLKWPLNPRMKPFRAYHLLSSFEDIIENQIACTRGAMWNGVAISKGGDTPLTLWADDGIVRDDRILRYFSEPNADVDMLNVGQSETPPLGDFTVNSYLVGFSRIAQGLRPMYRGQLVCRGRPDIHPWDICHVFDHYNAIFGPIEVESVTHHFSGETGFITTITPHCVAIANNHIDSWSVMKQSWALGGIAIGSVLLVGSLPFVFGFGLIGGTALALGLGLGAKGIGDSILEEITGVGISGNFHGVGQVGGLRTPVKIIPLQRMGTPWVAALRGWGRDPRKVHDSILGMVWEPFKGAVKDIRSGVEGALGLIGKRVEGLDSASKREERR